MSHEILVINPGSTSTKIGVFADEKLLFDVTLRHSAEELSPYATIADQKDFRKELVLSALRDKNYDAKKLSAVSARGGLVAPTPLMTGCWRIAPPVYRVSMPPIWAR